MSDCSELFLLVPFMEVIAGTFSLFPIICLLMVYHMLISGSLSLFFTEEYVLFTVA